MRSPNPASIRVAPTRKPFVTGALVSALLAGVLLPGVTPARAHAQADTSTAARTAARTAVLAPLSVTVTRDAGRTPFELPFATARLIPDASRPALRRAGIGDLLFGVPGVVVQDRANPSQDPRITVRGFGARSAFGVRGVRVLRDGIPLSLPDGQTPVDWLDLETIGTIDVVRGTAGALYGNAAGGVVDFRSRDPERVPVSIATRGWSGNGLSRRGVLASGMFRIDSSATSAIGNVGYLASVTGTHGDAGRTYSRLDATSAFARVFGTVRGTRLELQGTHYDAPRAENTGALTAVELARDPGLPDSLNITKVSRKSVRQSQLGVIVSRGGGANDVQLSAFVSGRSLDNPLPFAIVAVERDVAGASLRGTRRTLVLPWPLRLTAGADVQRQDDDRVNYENCNSVLPTAGTAARCAIPGAEIGALRLRQQELVQGTGVFARAEVEAPGRVFASAAVRHDRVSFRVRDAFVSQTNADDSGERTLEALTPMFGLSWRARPLLSFYANVTHAFETPTVTELTNQPDGAAGLNRALAPQRTATVEAGMQSVVGGRVRADLSLFRARVRDELVPFDVPNAPGRRAFRNAGRTSRSGVEASIAVQAGLVETGIAYTYSHFRFDSYSSASANFAGNVIPGIPRNQLQSYGTLRHRGWFATADVTASSRVSANDAATVFASGYTTWGLRGGYAADLLRGSARRLAIEPTVGVDNLFDRRFASSVVVNATRGRSFEPGTARRVYVGARLTVR